MGINMASTDAPFGLQPWGKLLGASYYAIVTANATAIHPGDLMERGATSLATPHMGQLMQALMEETGAAGSELGACLACFDHNFNPLLYIPVTTTGNGTIAGYVLVADDPMQTYIVQEDGVGESTVAASIGLNADMIATHAGSTVTGRSGMELDSSTKNTTATLALKILGVHPDDTISAAGAAGTWCRFIVKVNSAHLGSNIAGI
jgi:hypothetical protein